MQCTIAPEARVRNLFLLGKYEQGDIVLVAIEELNYFLQLGSVDSEWFHPFADAVAQLVLSTNQYLVSGLEDGVG